MKNSKQAHEQIKPFKPTIHTAIMDILFTYQHLELNVDDIALFMGKHSSQIFKRMSELEKAGKVIADGSKKGSTGRLQTIWRAVK
jgi:predicted ArsR family transcriptional regulator